MNRSIWNKLTKKELVHIIQYVPEQSFLEQFRQLRARQVKIQEGKGDCEPCWDCRIIAKKLGIE